jgi:hypothetical protein
LIRVVYGLEATYLGVIVIGLMHGMEPGHGWPIALMYAFRYQRVLTRGLVSSIILSFFHLISSIVVVAAYAVLNLYVTISTPEVKYVAAGVLIFLAYRFLTEKSKEEVEAGQDASTLTHKRRKAELTLGGLSVYAFILGFAHQEQVVLLALAIGGINPWVLMLIYATSVTLGLVGITVAILAIGKGLEEKIKRHEGLLPKVSGIVLIILAVSLLMGLWI